MNQNPSYRKLYNIEFIRFVFALCIIYFHLLHSFIMPYTEDSALYQHLADQARYAKYIVECFFLMSGYFLYQSIRKHPGQSTGEFVCRKISRLWAPLACSVILMAVFFWKRSLCFFSGSSVSPVQWSCYRLAGTELVCVSIFLCRDFLFYALQSCERSCQKETGDLPSCVFRL